MKIDYFKIINTFVKNTASSGVETKNAHESFKPPAESKTLANLSNQNTVLNQANDVKFSSINKIAQSKLIRELLNVPDDIQELLSLIAYKKTSPDDLKKLLAQENTKINTDLIKLMLEQNSAESMNKLIKLFQQAPGGTQNTEQMKDIMALLNQILPKKDASPQQTLTNLILLYLPWLPLSEKQDIEIRFEKRENNDSKTSEQSALVIYISTINLGRFRISIVLKKDYSLKIEIENFGEEDNKKEYLESILKEIKKQTRKDKIIAEIELFIIPEKKKLCASTDTEQPISGVSLPNPPKREVIISPSKEIQPVVIIAAQKIARIIIETDEKISLLETRKELAQQQKK